MCICGCAFIGYFSDRTLLALLIAEIVKIRNLFNFLYSFEVLLCFWKWHTFLYFSLLTRYGFLLHKRISCAVYYTHTHAVWLKKYKNQNQLIYTTIKVFILYHSFLLPPSHSIYIYLYTDLMDIHCIRTFIGISNWHNPLSKLLNIAIQFGSENSCRLSHSRYHFSVSSWFLCFAFLLVRTVKRPFNHLSMIPMYRYNGPIDQWTNSKFDQNKHLINKMKRMMLFQLH